MLTQHVMRNLEQEPNTAVTTQLHHLCNSQAANLHVFQGLEGPL